VTPQVLILLGVAVLLLTAGLLVLWLGRHRRGRTGVPRGRVIYDDTGAWQECPTPLFSQRYLLAGKPDYIVARGERAIPVEVKPGRIAERPYPSDVLQLAAYCLLIEENFDQTPPYGILKYATATFPVEYTPQLRRQLLATMESMRRDLTTAEVAPNHHSHRRCDACGHREHCGEHL
jgi:CRISPR-associated exonuclease Cas4